MGVARAIWKVPLGCWSTDNWSQVYSEFLVFAFGAKFSSSAPSAAVRLGGPAASRDIITPFDTFCTGPEQFYSSHRFSSPHCESSLVDLLSPKFLHTNERGRLATLVQLCWTVHVFKRRQKQWNNGSFLLQSVPTVKLLHHHVSVRILLFLCFLLQQLGYWCVSRKQIHYYHGKNDKMI